MKKIAFLVVLFVAFFVGYSIAQQPQPVKV